MTIKFDNTGNININRMPHVPESSCSVLQHIVFKKIEIDVKVMKMLV